MPTDIIVIILSPSLRKTEVSPHKKSRQQTKIKKSNKQTKPNRTGCPLPHAFMEDIIRHSIAQMTSASKADIPCLLVIIIK